jgi:hypothetical protein
MNVSISGVESWGADGMVSIPLEGVSVGKAEMELDVVLGRRGA